MTWASKSILGAIAGVRLGKCSVGTRVGKYKVLVRVGKHKLGARAGKYKFGYGLLNTNWGQ